MKHQKQVCQGSPPGHDVLYTVTKKLPTVAANFIPYTVPVTDTVVANTAFVACANLGWAMSDCVSWEWKEIPKQEYFKGVPTLELYKYLGNFSEHPYYSIGFTCEPCKVRWNGCAAAADCPECGRQYNWNDPSAPPAPYKENA